MKPNKMLHKVFLATLMLVVSNASHAGKFDIMFGGYSYSAKVLGRTTSLSGAGTYEAAYLLPISSHFELNLGYSFTMTNVIGGDYSYGPKLGVNFFPFHFSESSKIELKDKVIEVHDFFKPYVGASFNQRQFQSAKTSYAGFGLSVGCEKYLNEKYTIKGEAKMNSYTGASDATATEMNLLIGLVFNY